MDPGGMLLEDFGQRVDLTRRIREVLANYPEGTTALRELIQNADDVRLCLDLRAHSAYSLLAPALAQWQGPALLAHNDAAFTDDDFASISRIGGSKKTGRFGTYHKDEQKQGSSLGMELMVDGGAGGWMSSCC